MIVVGQSLGTQVAELVAADHADQVDGLVLLTPVPLGGTHLPDEAVAPFRALGGDLQAQRVARTRALPGSRRATSSTGSPRSAHRRFRTSSPGTSTSGTAELKDAPATSRYTGPVLLIRGGADPFVTGDLFRTVSPRFPQARVEVVDRGGHWLHVENPREVATMILEFSEAIADHKRAAGWRRGFAEQSQATFADEFADQIVLDASTLAKPVQGKERVATVMATASSIYESLEFTAEAHSGATTYLQWRATAFGGMEIRGITVLERDARGKIVAAAIHHRPLDVVLRFSADIRDRLAGVIPADHFLRETP